VTDTLLQAYVWVRARTTGILADERGEGVISAAIVVLIMAFLGAAMWVAFNEIWNDTATTTSEQVNTIGTE
jgi:hypothetical protein